MTHKAPFLTGLNTGRFMASFMMTICTISHPHRLPGLSPHKARFDHKSSPNITTITGDLVFLIYPGLAGFAHISVTAFTADFGKINMGRMGKINMIRLSGID